MPKALGHIARSATIIIMMFGSCPATGGELINNEPQHVTTVHSLQYAADILEGGYQIPITYEDPDITTLASIQPLSFVVVTQHISSQVPVEKRQAVAIDQLDIHLPTLAKDIFSIVKSDGGVHIIPKGAILDTPISIAPKERTTVEALAEICRAATEASGQELIPSLEEDVPYNEKINLEASNEPARSVLDRLLKEIEAKQISTSGQNVRLSWRAQRISGPWITLNLHLVPEDGVIIESHPLTVNDPRPIAAAIEELERKFLVPITYEDPERDSDFSTTPDAKGRRAPKNDVRSFTYDLPEDVVENIYKAEDPCDFHTNEEVRSCILHSQMRQCASTSRRKQLAAKAVESLLHAYADKHGADMFKLTGIETILHAEPETALHVVPIRFVDKSGNVKDYTPILDTPVTIAPEQRRRAGFLAELAKQLTAATGQNVLADTQAFMNDREIITIGASNEPARSVLDRLMNELSAGFASRPNVASGIHDVPSAMSWRLNSNPDSEWRYILGFHIVAPEGLSPTRSTSPCSKCPCS
jgi:hypothetical protein